MPMRKRYTSEPSPIALPASLSGTRRRTISNKAAPVIQYTSGMSLGRISISRMLTPTMTGSKM